MWVHENFCCITIVWHEIAWIYVNSREVTWSYARRRKTYVALQLLEVKSRDLAWVHENLSCTLIVRRKITWFHVNPCGVTRIYVRSREFTRVHENLLFYDCKVVYIYVRSREVTWSYEKLYCTSIAWSKITWFYVRSQKFISHFNCTTLNPVIWRESTWGHENLRWNHVNSHEFTRVYVVLWLQNRVSLREVTRGYVKQREVTKTYIAHQLFDVKSQVFTWCHENLSEITRVYENLCCIAIVWCKVVWIYVRSREVTSIHVNSRKFVMHYNYLT